MKKEKMKKKCIAEVALGDWGRYRQCKNDVVPGSDYCWLHHPDRIKKEKEELFKTYEQKQQERKEQFLRMQALFKIAEGIPTGILHQYKLVRKDK